MCIGRCRAEYIRTNTDSAEVVPSKATLIGVCSGLPVSTVAVEEATWMGSLVEELEAREAAGWPIATGPAEGREQAGAP